MADEIEVELDDKKDETPVSFIEDGDETVVTVGKEKQDGGGRGDDERWRQAEHNQARLANAFDDLRSRLTSGGGPNANPAPAQSDPWKAQEDAISEEERALGIQWEAHKVSGIFRSKPELLREFDDKARALTQRRNNIAAERAVQSAMPSFIAAAQQQQYRAKYSDVQTNPNANRYARGHYDQLIARGYPDTPDTVDLAMNAARREFNLGGARSSPTDRDRDQLTGYSNTRRTNMEPKNNTVKMGKSEKVMAMAMYGQAFNGDEKKVYATWAKNVGLRAQKAQQRARNAR
jgi:hypothetical protein